jgi:hypothetical protein
VQDETGTVVALAGRRIDPPEASRPRFPLERVEPVRSALRRVLQERSARAVVASAACGADLIALGLAEELGLQARVVLPFPPAQFRSGSVTDRPGEWAGVFERIVTKARVSGDLVLLPSGSKGGSAYAAANVAILDEAERLAADRGALAVAIIVWDGESRGGGDLTENFAMLARGRGMDVLEVSTLSGSSE